MGLGLVMLILIPQYLYSFSMWDFHSHVKMFLHTTMGSDTICRRAFEWEINITHTDTILPKSSLWIWAQLCYINSLISLLLLHMGLTQFCSYFYVLYSISLSKLDSIFLGERICVCKSWRSLRYKFRNLRFWSLFQLNENLSF